MINRDYIDSINNYYIENKQAARDIEIISYYGDILKIGLSWDITDPYDETLILKHVDVIDCPTTWVSDVNKEFISLINTSDDDFKFVSKRYNNKYKEGYSLLKIINDYGEKYYFSAKEIQFINKKLSIQDILSIK